MGEKILEKKICRHAFGTGGQFKVMIRMFGGGGRFSQYVSNFVLNLEIRKFDDTINKHRDIHRKFIMKLERDVRPLVQSLSNMCSLLFCSECFNNCHHSSLKSYWERGNIFIHVLQTRSLWLRRPSSHS